MIMVGQFYELNSARDKPIVRIMSVLTKPEVSGDLIHSNAPTSKVVIYQETDISHAAISASYIDVNYAVDASIFSNSATLITSEELKRRWLEYSSIVNHSKPDGDVMPIEEFTDACEAGGFIDYDGHGYYMINDKVTCHTTPSMHLKLKALGFLNPDITHIDWYNR